MNIFFWFFLLIYDMNCEVEADDWLTWVQRLRFYITCDWERTDMQLGTPVKLRFINFYARVRWNAIDIIISSTARAEKLPFFFALESCHGHFTIQLKKILKPSIAREWLEH